MTSKSQKPEVGQLREAALIAELIKAGGPLTVRQLAEALALRHEGRRALPKLLGQLQKRGEIARDRSGRVHLLGGGRPDAAQPQQTGKQAPGRKPGDTAQPAHSPRPRLPLKSGSRQNIGVITGRIVTHRDGYGFVVPSQPVPGMEGDLFVGRDNLGDAMNGDVVTARIERRRSDGRAEGRILRVLEREHPTVVGLFRYGHDGNVVLPYDTRILHDIIIPPSQELTPELRNKLNLSGGAKPSPRLRLPELDGAVVNVEVTRFPQGGIAPSGRVVEILGRPGEMGVDVEIIIRKHHLPHAFPPDVLAEARAKPQEVSSTEWQDREDFRQLPIVTIDGETARDFDDAVFVARLPRGRFQLQVHIADVAHYVERGSHLDSEARLRGTSVYFPDRAVPMLPEELSNGICSLNPRVERLVMSVLMEFDAEGQMLSSECMRGVIRSAERMTYTNVAKILQGQREMTERYEHLAGEFYNMRDLALLLNAQRSRRGSIDFDLPEPLIEFDAAGRMINITRSERNIAHRIIEEFMLAANEAVARTLERRGIPSLHRVHEKPDPKKVLEFEEIAHTFGYSLNLPDLAERRLTVRHGHSQPAARGRRGGAGRLRPMTVALPAAQELDIRPEHYQRLTQKIAGKPEERILSYLMLRSLRQARYAAQPLGHFALALGEYTHFTSPIRRYPDLIVHRILKWALANGRMDATRVSHGIGAAIQASRAKASGAERHKPESQGGQGVPYKPAALEEIALETSEAERRADAAERELMDWKTAQFMESHLGEEYEALIISVQKFGFFAELLEMFVEGLVPINRLEESTGESCLYRERDHALVLAKSRRTFKLGDRVRVRAERIDPFRHRVEFSLLS